MSEVGYMQLNTAACTERVGKDVYYFFFLWFI